MTAPGQGRACPDCGRPVAANAKLCECGYPLMFERSPQQAEPAPRKVVYKPNEQPGEVRAPAPIPAQPVPVRGYPGPQVAAPLGPRCPSCGMGNAPHRKRCEVCATELWPGAAMPAVARADDAVVYRPKRRRPWWVIALFVLIPLAVLAGVFALTLLL